MAAMLWPITFMSPMLLISSHARPVVPRLVFDMPDMLLMGCCQARPGSPASNAAPEVSVRITVQ
jgi:hypothetical protein